MAEKRGRTEERVRTARIPLGTPRRKLSLSSEQEAEMKQRGVVPRWINDRGDRLNEALRGGYEFERSQAVAASVGDGWGGNDISADAGTDTRISRVVGIDDAGQPVRAFLMTIPKEFYDEDHKAQQDEITRREKEMMSGRDAQGKPLNEGGYVPADGPSIHSTTTL